MFIHPDLILFPKELELFADRPYFVSSSSGWMNQPTFQVWARMLAFELSFYRQRLGRAI